jgi:hypothetical protein
MANEPHRFRPLTSDRRLTNLLYVAKLFAEGFAVDARKAAENLEVIRTLMERTTQYQLLTARAGLVAGSLAGAGALSFLVLDANNPWQFGAVWSLVFAGSFMASALGTMLRGRETGEHVWSRQAKAVVMALAPSLFAAFALSAFFFSQGLHLWLPGVWMLCYGQGALATAAYAPRSIRALGCFVLAGGAGALLLGPAFAIPAMGVVFGLGHMVLGGVLMAAERRETSIRLHRSVA